ncbi:T9SS type A sorting domain-containing protein [Emticicia agri]|uniref:T9SS type A sorting domain-containing protein n=1 Tax=Emticicia agri TaxID=2492393 RepID=A0A4Q5LXL8_9BACT|nr:T9SS type A sorting domain-containing protein [Emticicia agri]RYU94606.1 T9SS type A sorting domain-containing protein [Emticicia agri]
MKLKQLLSLAIFVVFLKPAMAQWKLNDQTPLPISSAINFQSAQLYATDDDANSYYVWSDYRTGVIELYVQKLDSRGVAQWQKDGVRIGNVLNAYDVLYSQRVIRPDGQGGAFIGWHLLPDVNNRGHRQFYAQHIDKDGKTLWAQGGIKVTDRELWTFEPYDDVFDIIVSNNQLLLIFNQFVGNTGTNTVYTKKLDFDGKTIEAEKKLFENNRIEDKVIYDAKNSRFLALMKHNQSDYVFQTFDATNQPLIPNPIPVYQNPVSGNSRIDLFKVDNQGNAVIGRTLSIDDGRKMVFAHKVDTEGKPLWGTNGVKMGSDYTFDIQIVPTSDGGGVATWVETANPQQPFKIAKITATGGVLWQNDVFTPRSDKPYILPNKLEPDGKDGAYTLWLTPKTIGYDLTVQHFDNNGSARFGVDGIAFKDFTYYSGPRVIPYPKGGVIVFWGANKEESDGIGYTVDLYTNYISETGRFGFEESPTIEIAPLTANTFCAGETFSVSVVTHGPAFSLQNNFKVLISDKNGSFANATEIGLDTRKTINVKTLQDLEKGTYKLKVVSTLPVIESSNVIEIVINEVGAPIITADKMSACLGETFKLTGSGCEGGTIKWSNNQEGTSISITLENTSTFTAACSIPGCKNSVASNEVSLQVNKATATASNSGPFNTGESIKLSSTGGVKYAWTGPANFVSTEQNPTIVNATPAMGGTYTVTVTDNNNCTAKAETAVTINTILGLEKEINIRTFPNPTSHEVIVEFYAQANNQVNISLIDMKGAVVGERKIKATGGYQQEVVDIRYFARGQYLIKVNSAKQEVIKKLIIEN